VTEPRIATLTVNPTVDIASDTDAVRPIHKLRTYAEMQDPGGGGVNVSRVIHELGGNVLALVMSGGFPGHFLEELLAEEQVPCCPLHISGRTRISYTVQDRTTGKEYRFVPEGPRVTEREWQSALEALDETDADWIVASGSLAPGMPTDFYARAADSARRRGRHFVLDTSGPPLRAALGHGLALIKPSFGEFEALIGHTLRRRDELEDAALRLVQVGSAERVAVTMGREGAMLANAKGVLRLPPIEVEARGAVGAGDSFMGALVLALARGASDADAFAWGMAAGAAAVMHSGTAHPARADVEALHARLREGADD
jgi:6-phosphofructokinase 2